MTIESECRALLAQAIGAALPPEGDVVRDLTPEWDSLKHVQYIFLLEDQFDVTLTEEDMAAIDSLQHAVALIQRNRSDAP